MQDRLPIETPRIPEKGELEPSPLTKITERQLLNAVACEGFLERFLPESEVLEPEYQQIVNPETEAYEQIRKGTIQDRSGHTFSIIYTRDLDNIGLSIVDYERYPIIHLKLRDRRWDGTPLATPPRYHREIGGLEEIDIPPRSYFLGGSNWNYSSEQDLSLHRAVEFSIVSSDPTKKLHDQLGLKKEALWISSEKLAHFIDDPFAFIPFDNPTPEALNEWYTMWWQVANRGLRGKSIPFPGQTSEKGFRGFFKHTVGEVSHLLRDLGYTHLSGIPTWQYVWALNIANGFSPEDLPQHEQALSFFTALDTISLTDQGDYPYSSEIRRNNGRTHIGDLDHKNPLRSWFAVLPFAMNVNPSFTPQLPLDSQVAQGFDYIFSSVKAALAEQDGILVKTYPFYPGKNLWHSKEV